MAGPAYQLNVLLRGVEPAIDAVFSDAEFWDMYELPRLLRHHAAHRGPIVANPIYTNDEQFTDANSTRLPKRADITTTWFLRKEA